eukprot:gene24161-9748_t
MRWTALLLAIALACIPTLSSARSCPHQHGDGSLDVRTITCPALAALVKNGDLHTSPEGHVTKDEAVAAMRAVGIAEEIVWNVANNNFDHLPGRKVR